MWGGRKLLSRGETCSELRIRSVKEVALGKVLRARARVPWSQRPEQKPSCNPLGEPSRKSRKRPPDCPVLCLVTLRWQALENYFHKPPTSLPTWPTALLTPPAPREVPNTSVLHQGRFSRISRWRNKAWQLPFGSRPKPEVPSACGQPASGGGTLPRPPAWGKVSQSGGSRGKARPYRAR